MTKRINKSRVLPVPEEISTANSLLAVEAGKVRNAADVSLVDRIMKARKMGKVWDVISLLVEAWAKRTPEDFNAFKIHLQDLKETRIDKKFATTPDKHMERRMIVAFPEALMYMIRKVYKADELNMDRIFYREFAKRFRIFQIPEKI